MVSPRAAISPLNIDARIKAGMAAFAGAAEMIRLNVQVIVAGGPEFALQAAVAASPTIPIVILANAYDPIARGYAGEPRRSRAATSQECFSGSQN